MFKGTKYSLCRLSNVVNMAATTGDHCDL
uniref:Uncharacterized protein n=1 Tax=Anguilla anguilla TaxID=7936 RepID=A0A0E9UZ29_ANGAN